MQLNDSTKTVGALIAVLLIPLAIIGWNFYTSQNSSVDEKQLTVEEKNTTDNNGIDINMDISGSDSNSGEESKVLGEQSNKTVQNNGNQQNSDQTNNVIGGVKSLPNTSRHPTPDID